MDSISVLAFNKAHITTRDNIDRIISTRLVCYWEKANSITLERAGFQQRRSTENHMTTRKPRMVFRTNTWSWQSGQTLTRSWKIDSACVPKTLCFQPFVVVELTVIKYKKATARVNGAYSRKRKLRGRVPQESILIPTLLLVLIKDVLTYCQWVT